MKKALPVISLIIVAIVGSFVNFWGTNLILSDVSNMFYGVHDSNYIASIPFFIVVLDFNFLMIYLYRLNKKPEFKKASTITYMVIFWVLSVVGIITTIISGIKVYGSFIAPYPFKGATLVILLTHFLIMVASVVVIFIADSKMEPDVGKRKITFKNSVFTVLLFFMIYLAFDRFGAFLWSPTFIHWRTFYMTWPFYLGLLAPMAQLVHTYLYTFKEFKAKPKAGVIYGWVLLGIVLASNIYTFIIGYFNTTFVSVISPMLALERLATLPADVIIIFVLMFVFSANSLRYSYQMQSKTLTKK